MKANEQIIAEAVRLEVDEETGKLYIVFEVTDPKIKTDIKKNWTEDIEYRLIEKKLIKDE